MDSGRFGRALGVGARLAGRTLVEAVDAASAPNPRTGERAVGAGSTPPPEVLPPGAMPAGDLSARLREKDFEAGRHAGRRTGRVGRGGKELGEAVWRPFARASGVLWLEVTGVFFGLIALFGLQGVWTWRWAFALGGGAAERRDLLLALAVVAVFSYFCVSSFARARTRGRR